MGLDAELLALFGNAPPKLPTYFIQFTGHICERVRPENFPKEVKVNIVMEFESYEKCKEFVQNYAGAFLSTQSMVVMKDPDAVMRGFDFEKRMIVPMHMISYIDCTVKQVVSEIPKVNGNGETFMPSGAPVVKQ